MAGNDPRVRAIEERAFNAWPAFHSLLADGWLFRFAAGATKRANSVNAVAPGGHFEDTLRFAETLFAAAGLPPIFRLSPLAGNAPDRLLAERGYRRIDPCLVMTGPTATVADPAVDISEVLDDAWLAGFAEANRIPPQALGIHRRILDSIVLPKAFAVLRESGQDVAFGVAVAERGMVGLFDIATLPEARRRGFGRRLVQSLLAWGHRHGAGEAYLQVVAANDAAASLYRQLGFQDCYGYHYRVGP